MVTDKKKKNKTITDATENNILRKILSVRITKSQMQLKTISFGKIIFGVDKKTNFPKPRLVIEASPK